MLLNWPQQWSGTNRSRQSAVGCCVIGVAHIFFPAAMAGARRQPEHSFVPKSKELKVTKRASAWVQRDQRRAGLAGFKIQAQSFVSMPQFSLRDRPSVARALLAQRCSKEVIIEARMMATSKAQRTALRGILSGVLGFRA